MYIEILSVSKKNEADNLPERAKELKAQLGQFGFYLQGIKRTLLQSDMIRYALNTIAKGKEKPDVVVIANGLNTKSSKSFRKHFVETVVASERIENKELPSSKEYWKKRNKAFKAAKKNNASPQEFEQLEQDFQLTRKKAKVFSLGDFGNGYNGYCFMYRGMMVAAVPKAKLTGEDFGRIAALATARTIEVFENSAAEYPGGFSDKLYVPPKTGFINRFIPVKGDNAGEVMRKLVVIASFIVFMAALGLLLYNMVFLSVKNSQMNGDIQRIAHGTEESPDVKKPVEKEGINWDKLLKINKEIVGWIQIKNTQVDYPVLWHKDDDRNSQYYLNHNYKGDYDTFGSIFLDYRCPNGTKSKNVIMHGHHMNDGSMFGELMKYGGTSGDLNFYKKTPTIEFDTPNGDGTYKIISVFKTNTLSSQGEFFNYMIGEFQNDKDFMNYVYNVRVRSLFNCPVDVNEDDTLITLSTCSYEFTNFRTVVVARKVRAGESKKVDVSKATLNKNAVWPNVYYSVYGGTRPTVTDFCTAYESGSIDWYNGDYDFKSQKIIGTSGGTSVYTTVANTTEQKIFYTVAFINYDGTLINKQEVERGTSAKKPANPVKPSDEYYDYVFKGWELDYTNVQYNMTIAPVFEPVLKAEYQ